MFRVCGRLLAKALLDKQLVAVSLNRPLLKHILAAPVGLPDLEHVDAALYHSLMWMLECRPEQVEYLCQCFTAHEEELGELREVELIPNGSTVEVTAENRLEFVTARFKYAMLERIAVPLGALLSGFYEVVPLAALKCEEDGGSIDSSLDAEDLEVALCGQALIDLDDWKAHTVYKNGLVEGTGAAAFFWRTVEGFDDEQRTRLLQFVTGTSRLPAGGFKNLIGVDGSTRPFELCGTGGDEHALPRSHTCFNRLDLPMYEDEDHMAAVLAGIVAAGDMGGFTME